MRRSAPAVARSSVVVVVGGEDYDGAASGIGQDAAGGDELTVVRGQFAARLVGDDEHQEGGVFDDPDGGTGGGGFTDLSWASAAPLQSKRRRVPTWTLAPARSARGSRRRRPVGGGAGMPRAMRRRGWVDVVKASVSALGSRRRRVIWETPSRPATSSAISATCGPRADHAFQHQRAVGAGDGDGAAPVSRACSMRTSGIRRLPATSVSGAPPPPPQQLERMPERSISTRSTPRRPGARGGRRSRRCSGRDSRDRDR